MELIYNVSETYLPPSSGVVLVVINVSEGRTASILSKYLQQYTARSTTIDILIAERTSCLRYWYILYVLYYYDFDVSILRSEYKKSSC
jgi:hypothetical protein